MLVGTQSALGRVPVYWRGPSGNTMGAAYGVNAADAGWSEFIGGAVASADDVQKDSAGVYRSPLHAIAIGVTTGVVVHVLIRLLDRWLDLGRK